MKCESYLLIQLLESHEANINYKDEKVRKVMCKSVKFSKVSHDDVTCKLVPSYSMIGDLRAAAKVKTPFVQ